MKGTNWKELFEPTFNLFHLDRSCGNPFVIVLVSGGRNVSLTLKLGATMHCYIPELSNFHGLKGLLEMTFLFLEGGRGPSKNHFQYQLSTVLYQSLLTLIGKDQCSAKH